MPVAKTLWYEFTSSPLHGQRHTHTYGVHVSTHIYGDTRRDTHAQGKATGHTHTSPLARANSYTGSKAWCNFSCSRPSWPAMNVNYKPYDPKFGTYPFFILHMIHRETHHLFKKSWWCHNMCLNININITLTPLQKIECKIEFWNRSVISQTRKTARSQKIRWVAVPDHKLMSRFCSVIKVIKLSILE